MAKPYAHGGWVYVRHVVTHPGHALVLAGAVLLGLAYWSVAVALLAIALTEIVVLVLLTNLGPFRRHVDTCLDRMAKLKAGDERAVLLSQMTDEHRRELLTLEEVLDRIRDLSVSRGAVVQGIVEECLALLASYVRLAIVYNAGRQCLAAVDRQQLENLSCSLEVDAAASGPASDVVRRRLAIVKSRSMRWDQSRAALTVMAHQLATIGELVRLAHERVAAPADPSWANDEIEDRRGALEGHQAIRIELTALCGVDETIEPCALDLGRTARV